MLDWAKTAISVQIAHHYRLSDHYTRLIAV